MIPPGGDKKRSLIALLRMGYYGNRELVRFARQLRKNMTLAEIILWSRLRSKQIEGYKFRRQQPLFDYVVDFYCDELKLIIEVDGEIHDSKENKDYDTKRGNILEINGYKIIRLSNSEITSDVESAVNKIKTFIKAYFPPNRVTTGDLYHE